jgi:lysophospholipase L1-like esterase
MFALLAILSFACAVAAQERVPVTSGFRLQDGHVLVFYGDSITEQKLYTSDIENYVLTRFPGRHIRFLNSGVDGDKVSGGWAGPIDLRLARDVFAYRPTMITIMLGMNDGYYRPFDPGIETTYEDGYRHIVERIQKELPQVSLTLLKPSPYDDVTRLPDPPPGYNTTMLRFAEFVGKLAAEKHGLTADLNRPVVEVLTAAKAADAAMSETLIRDRVHPGAGVHWVMAEAILKAWNAPAVVTSAKIDAIHAKVTEALNTDIAQLQRTKNGLSWVQTDLALPLPFPPVATDPFLAIVLQVSDLTQALNQEVLRVEGLAEGTYELQIDEHLISTFTGAELAAGVNLATLDTPMLAQSRIVALDTIQKNEIEGVRFELAYDARAAKVQATVKKLDSAIELAVGRQRKDAQPCLPAMFFAVSPIKRRNDSNREVTRDRLHTLGTRRQ